MRRRAPREPDAIRSMGNWNQWNSVSKVTGRGEGGCIWESTPVKLRRHPSQETPARDVILSLLQSVAAEGND